MVPLRHLCATSLYIHRNFVRNNSGLNNCEQTDWQARDHVDLVVAAETDVWELSAKLARQLGRNDRNVVLTNGTSKP
jgi:hypothetical protein